MSCELLKGEVILDYICSILQGKSNLQHQLMLNKAPIMPINSVPE